MSSIILSDFTAGELSNKYTSRVDDPLYFKGAQKLENMRPMIQGGFRSTGGTYYSGSLPGEKYRLISFMISESVQYLVCLGISQMKIFQVNIDGSLGTEYTVSNGNIYSEAQLFEVQFCQNYNELYFTHKIHTPRILKFTGTGFSFSNLAITTNAEESIPFQIPTEYPGACAFFGGRLYLAGTTSKPQGVWASVPFDPGNFTKWETIETVVSQISDPSEWADPEVPETEDVTEERNLIGDANSFHFEIASDQNDSIIWLATSEELIIGTITSEWSCPDDINANDISAKLKTRYGTSRIQARIVDNQIILIQRGNNKIREYKDDDSKQLTFSADHIAGEGIIQFDFQKIPESQIYFVRSDGEIAVLLYTGDIVAWYRLTHSNHDYESVAVVSTENGDFVFSSVSDGVNRWIERLDEDCLTQTTETLTVVDGAGIISSRLSGKTVQIWNDSVSEEVILDGINFTTSLPPGDYKAGSAFSSILETMSVEKEGEKGTSQVKNRRVIDILFSVLKGGKFKTGYTNDPLNFTTVVDTGLVQSRFRGGYDKDLSLTVLRDQAYPLEITVMIPDVEISEI